MTATSQLTFDMFAPAEKPPAVVEVITAEVYDYGVRGRRIVGRTEVFEGDDRKKLWDHLYFSVCVNPRYDDTWFGVVMKGEPVKKGGEET